jgi:hypothetical protein
MSISARELRAHFRPRTRPNYLTLAATAARAQAARLAAETLAPAVTPPAVGLDSLTIAADAMPHHYIARTVLLDLQPSQMVAALVAVEAAIHVEHPHAVRTGWRACSDSLRVYFSAWSPVPSLTR